MENKDRIPKIIHYCWLSGDPYPEKIAKCIATWKEILPDYEIILWDTNKFDINSNLWVKQAFENKRYAFAADYIRLYAVYNYGGIYLDSDVEVIKTFNPLLKLPYFVGRESIGDRIEVAAFGAEKGTKWIEKCLEYYKDRPFIMENGKMDTKVMPDVIHEVLSDSCSINLISDIAEFNHDSSVFNEFPNDWFCANIKESADKDPKYKITPSTFCVHHFANSWIMAPLWKRKLYRILSRIKRTILK